MPVKEFVWGSRLDELLSYRRRVVVSGTVSWETYYVLHGGQDTAAKLVSAAGVVVEQYEYDPYGRASVYVGASTTAVATSSVGLPFLWKAVRLDAETGLLYMRNRYYSTGLGRFLTRDPLGVWGDVWNMGGESAYAGCRPLVLGDPLGLYTTVIIVTYSDPTAAQQAEFAKAIEAALNTAENDPEGGEVIVIESEGDKGNLRSGMSVTPKSGKITPPKGERKSRKLVVMLHHGAEPDVGSNLGIDLPATHGNTVVEDMVCSCGPIYDSILVSACWLAAEPRTDDPDMLRENMTQRLARMNIGPVCGFDRKVMRRNDGAHVLPDGTHDDATDNPLAEPKPVPGKGQNAGGGR